VKCRHYSSAIHCQVRPTMSNTIDWRRLSFQQKSICVRYKN